MCRSLADQIDDLLPQTQCTKCGYSCCRDYAEAIGKGEADINQCPPGGATGISLLAKLLGKRPSALNPLHGAERPRQIAQIDETLCIGCTLCMKACPVDAIVGAHKHMHTVITEYCTGCDLCLAPCPVDCIAMIPADSSAATLRSSLPEQAAASRTRHHFKKFRLAREKEEDEARLAAKMPAMQHPIKQEKPESAKTADDRKKTIQAALEKARQEQAKRMATDQH